VYGSFLGFRPKMKSHVSPSYISSKLEKFGYELKHGQPDMSWKPWHLAIKDMVQPVTGLRNDVLERCIADYSRDILAGLSEDDLSKIHVYDDFTALNGAEGVNYVDKINRNTSAGAPWKKSKKHFLTTIPPQHGMSDPVELSAEITDRMKICEDRYKKGYRYMPVFCGNLKDEPVTFKKIDMGKTRVFTGGALEWSLVVRKYLLSFIRSAQSNRILYEMGPGTIAQSTEWGKLYKHLTFFGKDRMIAGDYAKFDKSMCSNMIMAAYQVIINICRRAGYSEEDLQVLMGISTDTAFPLVDFDGDLIEFFGSNPSGHPLTVIINSLANSLYMRYCYAILNPDESTAATFKANVNLYTYGDDNIMGVSRSINWFNHTSIQKVLADAGVTYTMADKTSLSQPFIDIDETSFLKRTWVWDEDVGAYLCPLEHDSIEKMLMVNVVSKTISPKAQAIAVMSSALREYFFYGKNIYNEKRKMLLSVVDDDLQAYVESSTFPHWETLRKEFWENSGQE
jgi:hypothetical protein